MVAPRAGGVVFAGGVAQFQPLPFATQSGQALFMPSLRSIGGIVAECTIEETGEDDLQITEHSVEQGAPIADHAFKRPSLVTIRAGWSRQHSYDLSAETGVYGLLLSWQAALMPFDVFTGKRHYVNMLIERLSVTTDQHSEYALFATLSCHQVILVTTEETTVPGVSSSPQAHADAPSTGPQVNTGDQVSTNLGARTSVTRSTGFAGIQGLPGGPSGPTVSAPVVVTSYGGASGIEGLPGSPSGIAAGHQIDANGAAPPADPPILTPENINLGAPTL
jgi:hypothetical protein